jgi:hypothetical protein
MNVCLHDHFSRCWFVILLGGRVSSGRDIYPDRFVRMAAVYLSRLQLFSAIEEEPDSSVVIR